MAFSGSVSSPFLHSSSCIEAGFMPARLAPARNSDPVMFVDSQIYPRIRSREPDNAFLPETETPVGVGHLNLFQEKGD